MICDQNAHSFHKEIPSAEHRLATLQAQGSKAIYEVSVGKKATSSGENT